MFKNIFTLFFLALLSLAAGEEGFSPTNPLLTSIQPIEPQNPKSEIPMESPLQGHDEPPHLESTTKIYESAFIKVIFFLIGLLVFVFAVFFIFKKFSSSRIKHSNHFRTIKLLEKRAISPKSMLYLIEIGGRKILLAESQLEIRNISNLEWVETEKKGL